MRFCRISNNPLVTGHTSIGETFAASVDLIAQSLDCTDLFQLRVDSLHGVLWVQTHFPVDEWDILLSDQACFNADCLRHLLTDAAQAGLQVSHPVVIHS